MNRIIIFALTVAVLVSIPAEANGPWNVMFQNIKLPSQAIMEHSTKTTPIASSDTTLTTNAAASTGNQVVVSTFSAQPDVVRNITITPTGTTSNVGAGTATVTGMNILGNAITEQFTINSASGAKVTGAKAFKSVSSVAFPQASGAGVTFNIGIGNKFGFRHCLNHAGDFVFSEYGGVYDTTRSTIAVDSTHVESNTFQPNSASDGAHDLDVFYVQNFRCF